MGERTSKPNQHQHQHPRQRQRQYQNQQQLSQAHQLQIPLVHTSLNALPKQYVSPESTVLGTPLGSMILYELESTIKSFIDRTIIDEGDNYEVEAKFGRFIDYNTNNRISLPVLTSCVLAPSTWYHFESDISMDLHRHFNQLFNEQVTHHSELWKYKHIKTLDSFYNHPQHKRLRVTREAQGGGRILEVIEKRRMADLAIHIPASPLDVRISINTETKVQNVTVESLANLPQWDTERSKDRISYEYGGILSVDLTQVRQGGRSDSLRHELEVELAHHRTSDLENSRIGEILLANILDIARFAANI